MNTKTYLKRWFPNAKKIVVFQNINNFSIPSLHFVGINPTHKILVCGVKKRKKGSHKRDTSRNHEKIAMVLQDYYLSYAISVYVLGLLVICGKVSPFL